jgi:Mg2+/Co2+ transporter CorB
MIVHFTEDIPEQGGIVEIENFKLHILEVSNTKIELVELHNLQEN